ncbi:peptide-methionine (S)-S-oxide reductase [Candidatus Woesearchaeota archaeon]|nr:MAG: peptide-methionine (S)-S-oxide reductase [Candidatus Woesearchaeota archaeon]
MLATFAGGCFWCTAEAYSEKPGVLSVVSGYAGGTVEHPTYEEVSTGTTGHREAIQITYDPKQISYEGLLDVYWRSIDPLDEEGQFNDRGFQYTTAIFYHDDEQKRKAERSKKEWEKRLGKRIATKIEPYKNFYAAEEYHQEYHKKNPLRYKLYKVGSGRAAFFKKKFSSE